MLRFAIVEDDSESSQRLNGFIQDYVEETNLGQVKINAFKNAEMFLNDFKANYDIVFLDIDLPWMNGMQVAERIRQVDEKVIIIFITQLAQYAIEGYKVSAKDYFIKPITYFELKMSLDRIVPNILQESEVKQIIVKSGSVTRRININDIYYIECSGHNISYHTKYDVIETRSDPLKTIEKKLEKYGFALCNSSDLINLKYCTHIENDEIIFDDSSIKITRSKKKEFLQKLSEYYMNSEIER